MKSFIKPWAMSEVCPPVKSMEIHVDNTARKSEFAFLKKGICIYFYLVKSWIM